MADNDRGPSTEQTTANPPESDPATFTLTLLFDARTGHLKVEGPIHMTVLCYGMLERAKDIVRSFENQQRRIVPASTVLPEFRAKR